MYPKHAIEAAELANRQDIEDMGRDIVHFSRIAFSAKTRLARENAHVEIATLQRDYSLALQVRERRENRM